MLIVEWYRVDTSRRVVATLGVAALCVVVGSVLVGASFIASRGDGPWGVPLAVAGWLATLVGPLRAIVGLRALLAEDRYLALTTAGLVVHHEPESTTFTWAELDAVAYDADRDEVVLERVDAAPVRLGLDYAGIARRDLAARIVTVRRRALFGLYEAPLYARDVQRRSA